MTTDLKTIRNIGPAMEAGFRSAGIRSAEELRTLGPDEAYRKLVSAGHRPHFIAYYSLAMGLQGRPWNDCQGIEKSELRQKFDQIVASAHTPDSALARALDEIGIRLAGSQDPAADDT